MEKKEQRITKKQALSDAFDVLFLLRDNIANILASDQPENQDPSDLECHQKAENYIKWYISTTRI